MRIVDIAEAAEHIPLLAHWHHREWAHLYPRESEADFARDLAACIGPALVPSTFVAFDGEVLGSASLIAQDMDSHPELTPWVASVYTRPAARGQGVASALLRHIDAVAARAGLEAIHLFTPAHEDFYAGLGWQVLARERYQGESVTLMRRVPGT